MEGHWETNYDQGCPCIYLVFLICKKNAKYAIAIPHLGSLILTHSMNGTVKGLKDFAPEDRPNSTWYFGVSVSWFG
jgi:cytochrome d ubiquinol oxidase subunit I